jgi:acetyl esterase/lipase
MGVVLKNRIQVCWNKRSFLLVPVLVLTLWTLEVVTEATNPPTANPPRTEENGISVYRSIGYTEADTSSQSLDLFLPWKLPPGPLPLVILIHGGGWLSGDKKDFAGLAPEFVSRGFAVATINYRLSSQGTWPAQIVDSKAAVRWLRTNASQYHLDPKRFAVGGHSAGAHLAAFLGATNGVKEFDKGTNLNASSDVQAVLWFSGIADLVARATTPGFEIVQKSNSDQSRLLGAPTMDRRSLAIAASPVTWVSRKTAPFFFEAGTEDKVVPLNQVDLMKAALDKYNIYSEVHLLKGVSHFSLEFFDKQHLSLIDQFLKRELHVDEHAVPPKKSPGKKNSSTTSKNLRGSCAKRHSH